ncbi:MAG TPA: citrate/2-methylcitrate synthase, partial [Trueperaceae bacterium]|nr:citrate/2-methylcitrate synthase [Trueperaceae bacterium]
MEQTINRGLDGVYIDTSAVCFIDGAKGQLVYRGYDINELADKASYEEVVYLLWHGSLPNREQLETFKADLVPHYEVP